MPRGAVDPERPQGDRLNCFDDVPLGLSSSELTLKQGAVEPASDG